MKDIIARLDRIAEIADNIAHTHTLEHETRTDVLVILMHACHALSVLTRYPATPAEEEQAWRQDTVPRLAAIIRKAQQSPTSQVNPSEEPKG